MSLWVAFFLCTGRLAIAELPPLAVKLPSGIPEADLLALRRLRKAVSESENSYKLVQNRTFGIDGASHETIFLHEHLDKSFPQLRSQLKTLARNADRSAGWSVVQGDDVLKARCLELIRYGGSEDDSADSIGWHADGATLLTMAIMLSPSDEYKGGRVQLKDIDSNMSDSRHEEYELSFGEAIAWRGWTSHRVATVTGGLREVFVVEWWLDEDCSDSMTPRAEDSIVGVRHAMQLAGNAANLHRWLGELLCEQLPCPEEVAAEAEAAFRRCRELAPTDATSVHALGHFLVGSGSSFQRAEGLRYLRAAHKLDPTVVRPPPEELGDLDITFDTLWKMAGVVGILLVLAPTLLVLERFDKKRRVPKSGHAKAKKA